jgi:hypothetical protein
MAQDYDARRAITVIRFGEVAPDDWRNLEQPKVCSRNQLALQAFRLASAYQAKIVVTDGCHLREGLILPEQVEVVA